MFLTLLVGIAATTREMIKAYDAEDRAKRHSKAAEAAVARALEAERRAQDALEYRREAHLAQSREARSTTRVGRRTTALDALTRAAAIRPGQDLVNEAIAALAMVDVRPERSWPSDSGPSGVTLAFDAGLRLYAHRPGQAGVLSIRETATGTEAVRLEGSALNAAVVAFSPDAARLAVKYDTNDRIELWLWDLATGRTLLRVRDGVTHDALAFSGNGELLAAGAVERDSTVRIYRAATGEQVRAVQVGGTPAALAFSADGGRLAVSLRGRTIRIFDVATGAQAAELEHPDLCRGVAFSPDGAMLAAACDDRQVHLWEWARLVRRGVLRGHQAEVNRVWFSPDGAWILTGGWDNTTRLWGSATHQLVLTADMVMVSLSADGRRIGFIESPAGAGVAQLVRPRGYAGLRPEPGSRPPYTARFAGDGRLLAASGHEGVWFWDARTGRCAGALPGGDANWSFLPGDGAAINQHPGGLERRPIRREGGTLVIGPPRPLAGFGVRENTSLRLSAGGRFAAFRSDADGAAVVLDMVEGGERRLPPRDPATVGFDISPDGRLLASYEPAPLNVLKVWDLDREEPAAEIACPDPVWQRFSPDGRWLGVSTRMGIVVHRTDTWQRAMDVRPAAGSPSSRAFAWTADSRLLGVSLDNRSAAVVDAASGRTLAVLEAPDGDAVSWVEFGPDGGTLAVVCATGLIHVWDLRELGEALKEMGLSWEVPALGPRVEAEPWTAVRVAAGP